MMSYIQALLNNRKLIAIAFVLIGCIVSTIYSLKAYHSYRHWQYIQTQRSEQNAAPIAALRPWMTMRYVSVAYGVPQEYIFAELNIPYSQHNSHNTLGHLSRIYIPQTKNANITESSLMIRVGQIIKAYLANPVAIERDDLRPWMTLEYIAHRSGVPIDYLFVQLEIAAVANNQFKPLERLADDLDFAGGSEYLLVAIRESLSRYKGTHNDTVHD